MKALFEFDNFFSLTSYFTTEKVCKEFLAQQRWGDDVVCPICGKRHCKQRFDGRYRCDSCKHNFSVISGTIFENTKVSLRKWFIAMSLLDDILQLRLIKSYCIFLSHIQFEISLLINT
ncbi:MAG: transposase [Sodaliphilus sp.]|nr:transposase [Sodaliphilus sp.]